MAPHVGQQVVDDLPQSVAIAPYLDGAGDIERDRPVGLDCSGRLHGIGGHGPDVDRGPFERAALVEPRQQEQVVDQHTHARRLLLDACQQPGEVLGMTIGPQPVELRVGAHRGHRRTQLVRRVGDELPYVLL